MTDLKYFVDPDSQADSSKICTSCFSKQSTLLDYTYTAATKYPKDLWYLKSAHISVTIYSVRH